jgi:hypothetical protein
VLPSLSNPFFNFPLLPVTVYAIKKLRLWQYMRNNNNNKAITQLAIPERQVPVLVDAGSSKAEGFVPSIVWSDKPMTGVRRVLPDSILNSLKAPEQRGNFQKDYGPVPQAVWDELLELVALWDRVSVGDWSPIIKSSASDVSVSRKKRVQHVEIKFKITGKSARFAICEAFTRGLSSAKLVVWWATLPNKFVLGLYCPDVATAIYASVLSALGTPGGIGVCQKCGLPFPRTRAKQRYCDHKCQVAAAMKRHRTNLKLQASSALNIPTKTKKRTGRK